MGNGKMGQTEGERDEKKQGKRGENDGAKVERKTRRAE